MPAITSAGSCAAADPFTSIIEAFRSERAYQRRRWGFRQADGSFIESPHTLEEWVLYMEDYLHEARAQLSRLPEPEARTAALATLRKVVTMGVAAFEQLGVAPRDLSLPIVNGRDGLPA